MFAAAVVMGVPSLRGTFLSGDDIQLVRDHALVNRPSLANLAELFTIGHRDLYQPVALASFQLDFAFVRGLGLRAEAPGAVPGVWVFHLTNVLLHGVCAVLACALAWRVGGSAALAGVVGVLFALHPLNVECVAWINGRMTLLSTVFLVAGLLTLERLEQRGGWWPGALAVLFAALGHMSKVQPLYIALLVIPWLARGVWPRRRWWWGWAAVALATAGFAALNVHLSASMIAGGAEHLHGSRMARTVLALGWYLQRIFVPIGLGPYHPTEAVVGWSHPGLALAVGTIVLAAVLVVFSIRATRLGWSGGLWLVAGLAATLPLVAVRNLAVAERYMYLPLVGGLWPVGLLLVFAGRRLPRALRWPAAGAAAAALCGLSWFASGFYRDDVAQTRRMVELYADDPRMVLAHAEALLRAGKLPAALQSAELVIRRAEGEIAGEAWQVIGRARTRLGEEEQALSAFQNAVASSPQSGSGFVLLGEALRRAGRAEEGLAALERGAELAPAYNPGLLSLAQAYRELGRSTAAAEVYRRVLRNNPYDVTATVGLAELELAAGDYGAALPRLESALELMPDEARVRGLYAWGMFLSGDTGRAQTEARQALASDPAERLSRIVQVGLSLVGGNADVAVRQTEALIATHWLNDAAYFDALAAAVQTSADRRAGDPWPYFVMALACQATGREEAARMAVDAVQQLTADPEIRQRAEAILGAE